MKNPIRIRIALMAVLLCLSVFCMGNDCGGEEGPDDGIIEFTFHSGCAQVEVKLFIDEEFKGPIMTNGSYKYNVAPGTHSYAIRKIADNNLLWSGQLEVPKGVNQGVTLTCTKG